MIYGVIVLAILGLLLLFFMIRMFMDTKRYSFRNVSVHKKQSVGKIFGIVGSLCLLLVVLFIVMSN
ncbi:hypothetical protein [Pseudalkalibacillus berkeleyi]|uniref:DUF3976 domain-containing protein n=1 Tax=Pseudalkalibacillus berkeleyi TaxID=1069813 RepID=A0ABS9GU25_9BACL|nr:hypothetical protein [Pseudalkalibacillus berkeleyi]MCF6136179.1 hypothetical protein [Pseudalkalibacillus berkeleyi]